MSPSALAFILILSISQVLGDEYTEEDISQILSTVNKTVDKLYERMLTQKNRDMDFLESKVKETYEHLRVRRDTSSGSSENFDQIKNIFSNLKDGLTSLVQNVSDSDAFKRIQKIGEEIQTKGKELGDQIESAIKSVKKDSE